MKTIKMILSKKLIVIYTLVLSFLFILIGLNTNVYAFENSELIIDDGVVELTDYYHNDRVNPYNSSMYDEHYEFEVGGALCNDDIEELCFKLNLLDTNVLTDDGMYYSNIMILGEDETIYADIHIVVDTDGNGCYVYRQSSDLEFNIYSNDVEWLGTNGSINQDAINLLRDFGLTEYTRYYFTGKLFNGDIFNENSLENCIYVYLLPTSLYPYSYTGYDYMFDCYTVGYVSMFFTGSDGNYFPEHITMITSSYLSLFDCVASMQDLGTLESELNSNAVNQVEKLFNSGVKEEITIEYLERVGDTPFAIKKRSRISVSVINDEILQKDIAKALNRKSMGVMQSISSPFYYDKDRGYYVCDYAKSIWLSAKSVDGNSCNYFLDCNLSYEDYYYQFVENGVFSKDLYDYMLNKIYMTYPETTNYLPSELYGYFGFVSIPNSYSINALWEEMFGTSTTFDGIISKFVYTDRLSFSAYNSLLEDYGYSWLEIAWSDIAGFTTGASYSCDTYLFYADCETNEAFIADNGATDIEDNDSLGKNEVDDVIDDIGSSLNELFDFTSGNSIVKIVISCLAILVIIYCVKKIWKLFK